MRRRISDSLMPSQVAHAPKYVNSLTTSTWLEPTWTVCGTESMSHTLDFGFNPVHLQAQQGGLFDHSWLLNRELRYGATQREKSHHQELKLWSLENRRKRVDLVEVYKMSRVLSAVNFSFLASFLWTRLLGYARIGRATNRQTNRETDKENYKLHNFETMSKHSQQQLM